MLALLFGIGVGLAFDEFALWLHLDDVYWSRQGRKSIDAVAWALVVTASVRRSSRPVHRVRGGRARPAHVVAPGVLLLLTIVPAVICVLKGKLVTAALGIVYQPIGMIGAFRLAKPGLVLGAALLRRATPAGASRSERRFGADYQARWDRLRDLVGGGADRADPRTRTPLR